MSRNPVLSAGWSERDFCSWSRSGATSSAVSSEPEAGSWRTRWPIPGTPRPSDYFDDAERENHTREWGLPTGDLTAYVRALRDKATTPNGVFGSKLMWNDFDWLRSSLHPPAGTDAGLEFMRTTFPNPQFVWLRRADKVRQGISWWRAAVTDQWGLRPGQEAEQPAPDVEQMVQLVRFAERCEDGWRQWFASTGIQPRQVVYEDLVRGQARGREQSPGVSPPSATRCRRPSARSLPQAGRQPDRDLRRPPPLSDEPPG